MNHDRKKLSELEKRVGKVESNNGWHESAKYVLEKLEDLTDAIKEQRKENTEAHRELHRKMDDQKTTCANRPMQCQRQFLASKTFYWVVGGVVSFMILIGGLSLANWKAITQAHADNKPAIEQPIDPKK